MFCSTSSSARKIVSPALAHLCVPRPTLIWQRSPVTWIANVRVPGHGGSRSPSSLSDFPRECAGSPFGDRFLVILGLILMDFDLLSSLRYAKRPTGPSGCASGRRLLRCDEAVRIAVTRMLEGCASGRRLLRCDAWQWKSHCLRAAPCSHPLKPHNASHAESPTGC